MYKLKKEYIGQNIKVFTPHKQIITLESADQNELEKAYKLGHSKFIVKASKKVEKIEDKEDKEEIKEVKKPGRPAKK